MSTVSQTLQKAQAREPLRLRFSHWLRRVCDKYLDSAGLRAPLGYEDENGFHYGTLPLAEQQEIARRNMTRGEEPAAPVSVAEQHLQYQQPELFRTDTSLPSQ